MKIPQLVTVSFLLNFVPSKASPKVCSVGKLSSQMFVVSHCSKFYIVLKSQVRARCVVWPVRMFQRPLDSVSAKCLQIQASATASGRLHYCLSFAKACRTGLGAYTISISFEKKIWSHPNSRFQWKAWEKVPTMCTKHRHSSISRTICVQCWMRTESAMMVQPHFGSTKSCRNSHNRCTRQRPLVRWRYLCINRPNW
jgi:hypothetical protein